MSRGSKMNSRKKEHEPMGEEVWGPRIKVTEVRLTHMPRYAESGASPRNCKYVAGNHAIIGLVRTATSTTMLGGTCASMPSLPAQSSPSDLPTQSFRERVAL